jgi:two-component system LytT family response regulator
LDSNKKNTCVIVEDDKGHQEILQYYLDRISSLEVIGIYSDTVKAVISIEKHRPDIIFLDINISGLQGPEFIELLEYQPKVIMVSAFPEDYMTDNFDIAYQAYIQKPIDEIKLRRALSFF